MIGSARGFLIDKDPSGEIVLEVAGIGYCITVNVGTLVDLPELGEEAFLHVHHHMREDTQQLYGFLTVEEKKCFESVIAAHGVGPALGMAVLATLPPSDLRQAVASEDVESLCLVPGVGKKTAQRMILDLKNRLEGSDGEMTVSASTAATASPVADVREALSQMGFGAEEIRHAVTDLQGSDLSSMLREALRRMAKK
ncbi:MAG: Holliday junction branch migration protein RuvA [Acidimicrobiaceae bacterium]|nr:Holliday junction branch migration protein RuvA [Acidimicrobiaceae bacterium]|tara:strand:- start:707 stop:1297 length:591 start_codon:yes stop_codon:yes gene_type:complete